DTGSLAVPTNSSLEAMIIDEDNQEMLAAARRIPNAPVVQLPDQAPQYVRTDATSANQTAAPSTTNVSVQSSGPELKPIDNSVKTLQLTQTSDTSAATAQPAEIKNDAVATKTDAAANPVEMTFGIALPDMRTGEKIKVPVMLTGTGTLASAVIGLKFDDKSVAIRSVSYGDLFGLTANSAATPFLNQNGKMYVSLTSKDAVAVNGILAYIEIEALVNGKPVITFDRDVLNLLAADGKTVGLKLKD
ncbi:MAG TPA: cohesin domain-containing protein, partial [Pyrinomonadaceae bacterium]|nr:cohesin domain-containing protein [Pyrinomonadaceae bacterium]